jgi:hypothetical protein
LKVFGGYRTISEEKVVPVTGGLSGEKKKQQLKLVHWIRTVSQDLSRKIPDLNPVRIFEQV